MNRSLHIIIVFFQQAVVRIVREKYLNQAKTSDKAQLQKFLSELYVFLSDQMHTGLNKVIIIALCVLYLLYSRNS